MSDVAGLHNAKREIMEFGNFLKDNAAFLRLGAKTPKGALLAGPPGTGKTLLARALAGETNCYFTTMSGSEFTELFVGSGSLRVRKLFKKARKNAPAIIFIDEIDALATKRNAMFSNTESDTTLNQLLVEMDGFTERERIIVLAGTNRPDMLDPALLRPGRFDRRINLDLPDLSERKEIFQMHLKSIKTKENISTNSERLAALSPSFSGADIANVCNESAILAARRNAKVVSSNDFEKAFDRILAGLERSRKILSPRQRRVVAYHEAGHAVSAWFLEHADPLLKVTIRPRAGSVMGFSQHLPKEVRIFSQDQIMDQICVALGGRVAEHMFFNQFSTGAGNDLEKATETAYRVVREFGMSKRVGNLSFPNKDERSPWIFSDSLSEIIDVEAMHILRSLYSRVQKLLSDKRNQIEALATALLKHETLTHNQVVEVLGKRPFVDFYVIFQINSI